MQDRTQTLVQEMRKCFVKRGATTRQALARTFRALDSFDGNKKLSAEELRVGLTENGMNITPADASLLMAFFDKSGDGWINFDEFLAGVRG